MDNLAHTLCGAALARTRLGKSSRLATASLVVGANLPDLDIVSRLFGGKEAYLVHHRGVTHSFAGIVVETLLLAALVRAIERRSAPDPASPGWRAFLVPAFVGLLSHLALDWLNNYGVRPWLPFSHARYFGDLVSIVDPFLWLIFGAIALLAGPRTRFGHVAWAVIGVFTLWLVFTSERSPASVKTYWPYAIAGLATLRALGVGRMRPRRVLIGGSLVLAAYLGGLELSATIAWRNAITGEDPIATGIVEPWRYAMRSPMLADPFRWTFFVATDHEYWHGVSDARRPIALGWSADAFNLGDPRARAALASPSGRAWLYFARLPTAKIDTGAEGQTWVWLRDARYSSADWSSVTVLLPPTDRDR